MHRTDGDGALPGGFFTEGNPSLGQAATVVTDNWLNDVQENIAAVIENAGITLIKDDFTQLDAAVDLKIAAGLPTLNPAVSNMSYDLDTGTFRLVGKAGAIFSPTNRSKVSIADALNPGKEIDLYLDSDTYFFDDANGTSDIIGMEYGRATGVVQAAMPSYQYITYDASLNTYLVTSHDWNMQIMPATIAEIGYKGAPSTSNEDTDAFVAVSTDERAALVGRPVTPLGSVRWTMDVSDDWAINTLSTDDGVGKYHWGRAFGKSIAQPSGAGAFHFFDNGGTAPDIPATGISWRPLPGGLVKQEYSMEGAGANGSGAVGLALALQFKSVTTISFPAAPFWVRSDAGVQTYNTQAWIQANAAYVIFVKAARVVNDLQDNTSSILNSEFTTVNRGVRGSITYSAFGK